MDEWLVPIEARGVWWHSARGVVIVPADLRESPHGVHEDHKGAVAQHRVGVEDHLSQLVPSLAEGEGGLPPRLARCRASCDCNIYHAPVLGIPCCSRHIDLILL